MPVNKLIQKLRLENVSRRKKRAQVIFNVVCGLGRTKSRSLRVDAEKKTQVNLVLWKKFYCKSLARDGEQRRKLLKFEADGGRKINGTLQLIDLPMQSGKSFSEKKTRQQKNFCSLEHQPHPRVCWRMSKPLIILKMDYWQCASNCTKAANQRKSIAR